MHFASVCVWSWFHFVVAMFVLVQEILVPRLFHFICKFKHFCARSCVKKHSAHAFVLLMCLSVSVSSDLNKDDSATVTENCSQSIKICVNTNDISMLNTQFENFSNEFAFAQDEGPTVVRIPWV